MVKEAASAQILSAASLGAELMGAVFNVANERDNCCLNYS